MSLFCLKTTLLNPIQDPEAYTTYILLQEITILEALQIVIRRSL